MNTNDPLSSALQSPLLLSGYTQHYAWGMGASSLVARFSGESDPQQTYAELWFGDHPNGPAHVAQLQTSLRSLTTDYASEILGNVCINTFGSQLPFLFKILSVGRALSIQAHPDTGRAQRLHAQDPAHYPDRFPKPEVGYALSHVELLYGFRAPEEILKFLLPGNQYVPEFQLLLDQAQYTALINSTYAPAMFLRQIYSAVMQAPKDMLTRACKALFDRLQQAATLSPEEEWILSLQAEYPEGDVGLFSFFILNLVTVEPGSALFIGPNIVHAYLRNELAECMAPSDNVVRAGLTPKFMDVSTLLDMLEYQPQPPQLIQPIPDTHHAGYGELPLPDSEYFQLGIFSDLATEVPCNTNGKVEMIFALEGTVSVITDSGLLAVTAGTAALIPASIARYAVTTSPGRGFRIRTP